MAPKQRNTYYKRLTKQKTKIRTQKLISNSETIKYKTNTL